ncbi:hypothetical protein Tco_1304756 [Tanacetum coccineum]
MVVVSKHHAPCGGVKILRTLLGSVGLYRCEKEGGVVLAGDGDEGGGGCVGAKTAGAGGGGGGSAGGGVVGDRVDRVTRNTFGLGQKSPSKNFSGGGVIRNLPILITPDAIRVPHNFPKVMDEDFAVLYMVWIECSKLSSGGLGVIDYQSKGRTTTNDSEDVQSYSNGQKEQTRQEEAGGGRGGGGRVGAGLAEAMRLQALQDEEDARQVHLDALLAKRIQESKLEEMPESLKEKLTCAPVIVSPNWNLLFELMCDASDVAVGAV